MSLQNMPPRAPMPNTPDGWGGNAIPSSQFAGRDSLRDSLPNSPHVFVAQLGIWVLFASHACHPTLVGSISHILGLGASKQMIGTHTAAIRYVSYWVMLVTGMTYVLIGHAIGKLVGQTMGGYNLPLAVPNGAVSESIKATSPEPAAISSRRFLHARPEPFFKGRKCLPATLVQVAKTLRLSLNRAMLLGCMGSQFGWLPTAALTKANRYARMGLHDRPPFDCAVPPGVISTAGAFACPHYSASVLGGQA